MELLIVKWYELVNGKLLYDVVWILVCYYIYVVCMGLCLVIFIYKLD